MQENMREKKALLNSGSRPFEASFPSPYQRHSDSIPKESAGISNGTSNGGDDFYRKSLNSDVNESRVSSNGVTQRRRQHVESDSLVARELDTPVPYWSNWNIVYTVEFYLIVFGVCAGWSVLVLLILKFQRFPVRKHIGEVVLMVTVPVILTFLVMYLIDRSLSRPVRPKDAV
jgi:hypothetical protein